MGFCMFLSQKNHSVFPGVSVWALGLLPRLRYLLAPSAVTGSGSESEAFRGLRLIPGKELEVVMPDVRMALIEELLLLRMIC